MADLFSDGQDALFTPDQGTVQQQVIQAATPVPTATPVPVPAEQDSLDREASAVGDPLTLQAVNLVKEWKRFRTLIQ